MIKNDDIFLYWLIKKAKAQMRFKNAHFRCSEKKKNAQNHARCDCSLIPICLTFWEHWIVLYLLQKNYELKVCR